MDGVGRYLDNMFVERFWRTLKYEEVYLKAYQDARSARREIGDIFGFTIQKGRINHWDTKPRPRSTMPDTDCSC